ncbi:MAG: hypothetical protein Kow0063_31570 [Anaerolineae bacterium]
MHITKRGEKARWEKARRRAFVQDVLAVFTQRPADLLPFEEVRRKLQLKRVRELGLQDVPLDHIVGSVGRYHDFNRAFFPRQEGLKERWQRVDRLMAAGKGYPPVELYKVGQVYFVRDGNHRVSVARQHSFPTIQAYVWEYQTDMPVQPETDIDELLCQTAHAAFIEQTRIDRLCPDLDIRLTQPDGYADLLNEIQAYQAILSQIDGQEIPFDEALVLWAEMRYTPIVDIIRQRDILQDFPGRTETDLYLWLCRNQQELAARYGDQVLMEEAADDLDARFRQKRLSTRPLRQALRRLATAILNCSTAARRALRRVLG